MHRVTCSFITMYTDTHTVVRFYTALHILSCSCKYSLVHQIHINPQLKIIKQICMIHSFYCYYVHYSWIWIFIWICIIFAVVDTSRFSQNVENRLILQCWRKWEKPHQKLWPILHSRFHVISYNSLHLALLKSLNSFCPHCCPFGQPPG